MNYQKVYFNLIELCKTTLPFDRLKLRKPNDARLNDDYLYTENHHIIPKHCGGNDDENNLITLLPEEHYLIHLLRYKVYNDRNDFLSVRLIVNGYMNKKNIENGTFLNKLGVHKHMIQKFRKEHGWHTKTGVKAISKSRKGTMPVMDAITNIIIGSVPTNHENVLNGKWVHITKGKSTYFDENGNKIFIDSQEAKSRNLKSTRFVYGISAGKLNANYREMTQEYKNRIFSIVPISVVENHLIAKKFIENINNEFKNEFKTSRVWIQNNFGTLEEFVELYNTCNNANIKFNPYFRSTEQREKARMFNINKKKGS